MSLAYPLLKLKTVVPSEDVIGYIQKETEIPPIESGESVVTESTETYCFCEESKRNEYDPTLCHGDIDGLFINCASYIGVLYALLRTKLSLISESSKG